MSKREKSNGPELRLPSGTEGRQCLCILFAIVAGALGACASTHVSPGSELETKSIAQACAAFRPETLSHNAKITKTELRDASDKLPTVCIVRGTIVSSAVSTINWAVELPEPGSWNGKTLTIGGGGFDGFIPTDEPWYHELVGASGHPYVKISSDSGHQTRSFEWGRG